MAKRVLLLTQWFDPEPTFKGQIFARELLKQGYDVEVVTGFPNYPGGRVYAGYKIKLLQREITDGVHVTRVPLYPNHTKSAFKRVLNYVSFSASALIYCLFIAKRADVIYAYHPPLTVGVVAILVRFFRKIPVVYDIQDMWPDTLQESNMVSSGGVLGVVSKVCDWVYCNVDQIVVLSPGFKRLLIERSVPENKITVIYNWCDEVSFLGKDSECTLNVFADKRHFNILFAGNMGSGQALGAVLDAADITRTIAPKIRFIFVGDGIDCDSLREASLLRELDNVIFMPRIPMSDMGPILSAADALLVHLKDTKLFSITIPSKLQAYMAAGRPILMAVSGDASEVVQKAQCGVCAKPEAPESIANAAICLSRMSKEELSDMGMKGISYYSSNLSLQVGVTKFVNLFNRLTK